MTIPMPLAETTDARAYPLIDALFARHGCADVRADNVDAFLSHAPLALLVFLEDPRRCKEALDLAVIVPEIARAFPGRFAVGVLLPEAARALHARYGFRRWPALVVLRDAQYVGAVDGLRDWTEYLAEIARLAEARPARAPIPIHNAPGKPAPAGG
jgi:hydrogenase-1 operon protein HyaE